MHIKSILFQVAASMVLVQVSSATTSDPDTCIDMITEYNSNWAPGTIPAPEVRDCNTCLVKAQKACTEGLQASQQARVYSEDIPPSLKACYEEFWPLCDVAADETVDTGVTGIERRRRRRGLSRRSNLDLPACGLIRC